MQLPRQPNKQIDALIEVRLRRAIRPCARRPIRTSCSRSPRRRRSSSSPMRSQRYWTKPTLHGPSRCPRSRSARRICGASHITRLRSHADAARHVGARLPVIRLVPWRSGATRCSGSTRRPSSSLSCGPISGSTTRSIAQYVHLARRRPVRGDFGLDYRSNEQIGRPAGRSAAGDDRARRPFAAVRDRCIAHSARRRCRGAPAGPGGGRRGPGREHRGISVPDFWLGIMLILASRSARACCPPRASCRSSQDPVENLRHVLLPSIALAAGLRGGADPRSHGRRCSTSSPGPHPLLRGPRASQESNVILKHALRNAAIPIVDRGRAPGGLPARAVRS